MRDRRLRNLHAEAEALASQTIAAMLMSISNTAVPPLREWLAGQRAYFLSQGYSDDEARAMAASTYVTVFGSGIARTPPQMPDEDDPREP